MSVPQPYDGEAYNTVPDSANRIHSDEVARQFGFEGALVPGVTISAYLAQPAVVAWGESWLRRGRARITVHKPLYDRRAFRVGVTRASETGYDAELVDAAGTLVATGRFDVLDVPGTPPVPRHDTLAKDPVPATRHGLEILRKRGMGALRLPWVESAQMVSYFRDPERMPSLLQWSGGGYANSSFLLGLSNWHFAANVTLGPWVHLETESQHFAAIPRGSELVVEGAVQDLFERKGHAFADVDVAAFLPGDVAAIRMRLRAIYRLRGDRGE